MFPYGKAPFDTHTPGYVFPVFTIIEMVCYMGWIKVAESLLNPFGSNKIGDKILIQIYLKNYVKLP